MKKVQITLKTGTVKMNSGLGLIDVGEQPPNTYLMSATTFYSTGYCAARAIQSNRYIRFDAIHFDNTVLSNGEYIYVYYIVKIL